MSSIFTIPAPLKSFYSLFPLKTWPPNNPAASNSITKPALWILPPRNTSSEAGTLPLSSDVECLKWQAFLALRGLTDIDVRWDISPDGAIDGRLPNLHVPRPAGQDDGGGELLVAHTIPGWVDKQVGNVGPLEGYRDEAARDESHAWVSLLEGKVHAALVDPSCFACGLFSYIYDGRFCRNLNRPLSPLFSRQRHQRCTGAHYRR